VPGFGKVTALRAASDDRREAFVARARRALIDVTANRRSTPNG
jgi:hypothetical protein